MSFNPFSSVVDYPGMLNKISTYTFFGAVLSVWLLRGEIPYIDNILSIFNVQVPIMSGFHIPLGTFLPAFLFALISRIIKLHDRISDVLKIRQRFDVEAILLPLAIGSNAVLKASTVRKIRQDRQDLMYKVFYKYASSSPGKAVIESHYITMALDQWSWYWIMVESSFLAVCLAIAFLIANKYLLSTCVLFVILIVVSLLTLIRNYCVNYALQEVEQILDDHKRKSEISEVFRALQN